MKITIRTVSRLSAAIILAAIICAFLPAACANADDEYQCWAVFVGISEYQHIDAANGCDEGARGLYELFSPVWGEDNCRLIVDEKATEYEIRKAVRWLAENAGQRDIVLLYYAGHGDPGGYLATYWSLYADSWISITELKTWLQDINSEKMTVILDTCHSGRFSPQLAREGRIILTSSQTNEVSYVMTGIGGIFTYYLTGAIEDFIHSFDFTEPDTCLTVEEIFYYAEPETIEDSTEYADTVQHPVISDGYEGELNLLINFILATEPFISYRGDIFIVDGEAHGLYDVLTWAPGSVHSLEVFEVVDTETGTKYMFNSWEDGEMSPSRDMSSEHTYRVLFDTQHRLNISSDFGKPQGQGWYDEDAVATVSIESIEGPDTRRHFTGWRGDYKGDEANVEITMDAPKTVTAKWESEYLLNVESLYGSPAGAGWYDEDAIAAVSIESVEGPNTKRHFTGWSGDYSGSESNIEITMDAPKTITAGWHSEYLLNIESEFGSPAGAGWYDEDALATVSIESIEEPDTKRHFTGWSGDYSGSENNVEITIDSPKLLTANWESEYLLSINSEYESPNGAGWYTEGAVAEISVPSSHGMIVRQVFDGWSEDYRGDSPSAYIDMVKAMTITANWRTDYLQLYMLVGGVVLLVIIISLIIILSHRRKRQMTLLI